MADLKIVTGGTTKPILRERDQEFLRVRAIKAEIAAARVYRTIYHKQELQRLGFTASQQNVPALAISLHNVFRAPGPCQIRPDTPRLNKQGKPLKYELPFKARLLLDVHPRHSNSTNGSCAAISDPRIPLFVTESAPKADALTSLGLCAVAIIGVYGFRHRNEAGGKVALADFQNVALNERIIYIALDSDIRENLHVFEALRQLKEFLERKGATVRVICLPPLANGAKSGVDDYIFRLSSQGSDEEEIRTCLLGLAVSDLPRSPTAQAPDKRPKIVCAPGEMPQMVDAAKALLRDNAIPLKLFQRTNEARIVQVITLDKDKEDKKPGFFLRPRGSVMLVTPSAIAIQDDLETLAQWVKYNMKGEEVTIDCPPRVPLTWLARVCRWDLPELVGSIGAPIMRSDGSIVNTPGYDPSTGLYFSTDFTWPLVPQSPTPEDAIAAAQKLLAPFGQFPFISPAARAVYVAEIETAIQRRLLRSAPLFGHSAPTRRTGKSLLAQGTGILAMGHSPASSTASKNSEEFRKLITSVLLEGHAITNLDNIDFPLKSSHLCRAVTEEIYGDRVLGVTETKHLRTNMLWIATGNNLVFKGDLSARALLCRIDPKVAKPEERTFVISDLPCHLLEHRVELVVAALTILRAFFVAGRPSQKLLPWGGFDQWSREIREPVVWLARLDPTLALADPCETREGIEANDPEQDSAVAVLAAWSELLRDQEITLGNAIRRAVDADNQGQPEFKSALLAVARDGENLTQVDAQKLGVWCREIEDRVFDGYALYRSTQTLHRAVQWLVKKL